MTPLVSIIIPTRDRPRYLENALLSVKNQTYSNIEVIVCDNYVTNSCKEVFDRHADSRFQYIKPERPLTMCDNWELGVSKARGQYVGVVIDKTFLLEHAISTAVDYFQSNPVDFVSWGNGAFIPVDETLQTSMEGQLVINENDGEPYYLDLRQELRRRVDFSTRMEDDNHMWPWGKICFGLFSRDLLTKVRDIYGRVFFGIAPDHDSAMAALAFADRGVYLNKTLQISVVTTIGTGITSKSDTSVMRKYFELHDPSLKIFERYPIPGVWASPTNGTAYGYQLAIDKFNEFDLKLNLVNLAKRTAEDLTQVVYWSSLEERLAHYKCLWEAELRLGIWKQNGGRLSY